MSVRTREILGVALGVAFVSVGLCLRHYSLNALKLYLMVFGCLTILWLVWLAAHVWRHFDGKEPGNEKSNRLLSGIFIGIAAYFGHILYGLWQVEKDWALPFIVSVF